MSSRGSNKTISKLKDREAGFDLQSIKNSKLNEYNALHDPNMRFYFENPSVQKLLYESGQIDKYGRVINLEKNKTKIHILERGKKMNINEIIRALTGLPIINQSSNKLRG